MNPPRIKLFMSLQWGNWDLKNLKVMFEYRADRILMDETRRGRVKDEWILKDEL